MIERLVAFALHQRFITLALAVLLTAGGIVSFYRLPIEAYPDVVDVEVDVITLWPGHAAEEVERLVTIALEKELNGVANLTFLRSISIFGLSNIRVFFADGTDSYWARSRCWSGSARPRSRPTPSPARPPGQRDRRGVSLHARIEDAAVARAEGPPGLDHRA